MIIYKFADGYYIVNTDEFISNDVVKIITCCLLGQKKNKFNILPLDVKKILYKYIFYFKKYKMNILDKYSSRKGIKNFEKYLNHQFRNKDDLEWFSIMIGRLICYENKRENWPVMLHLYKKVKGEIPLPFPKLNYKYSNHLKILDIICKMNRSCVADAGAWCLAPGWIDYSMREHVSLSQERSYILPLITVDTMKPLEITNLINNGMMKRIIVTDRIDTFPKSSTIESLVTFSIDNEMFDGEAIDEELASIIILCNKMYLKNCGVLYNLEFNRKSYDVKDSKTCNIS